MTMTPVIKVRRVRPSSLPLPRYQSAHAAGMDLVADIEVSLEIAPMGRAAVPAGIAVEIPPGFEGQVRPRSGRALEEGLTLVNSPGTVDADYRGEIKVLLVNLGSRADHDSPRRPNRSARDRSRGAGRTGRGR